MRGKTFLLVFILLASLSLLFGNETLLNQGNNEISLIKNLETEISIDYRLNSLAAQTVSTTNGEFTQLSLTEFGLTGKEGEPQLPYSSKIIAVPEGAKVITTLTTYSSREIRLNEQGFNSLVLPAQPSVSKSAKPEDIKFIINENIYQSVDYIQQTQVEAIEIGYLRGMRLFEVNYYPVTYNPTKNSLSIIQEATLDIEFSGADMSATQYLRDKTFSPAFEVNYPTTIFNYQSNRSTLESYPLGYIIVTPNNFLATMQPFINWKIEQGYAVTVLNTNTIGSTTSSISTAIQNIWNSATPSNPAPSYLLIVGDTPQVPAFASSTISGHISDLSYVRLSGNDYLPEMYFGRFSATSVSQLQPQVAKTLMYEKYEMPDPSYLARVTLIAGVDGNWAPTHGNGTINYGSQYYFNAAHDLDVSAYPYPMSGSNSANIIADVSAGVGYLNYTAHGSETTWHDPSFTISNVNSLTNTNQYPVVIGNCCLTNHFDTGTCFGEAWLRATNGAVIYIGGTNSTYWDEDYWWSVGHFTPTSTANPTYAGTGYGMYDALFHEHGEQYVNWVNSAGSLVYRGNMTVQASSSSRKNYYWEIYSIMGDPSLIPYVGIPEAQIPSYVANLPVGSTSLNITAAPHSYVALTVNNVIIGTQILGSTGSGVVSFPALNTNQPVKMVISRVDYQPYIVDIPVITADGPYLSLADYSVNDSNNNGLLEYDETGSLNLTIENIGTQASGSGTITFSESDPYLTLTSTSASFTRINAGSSRNINSVINFTVANNVPNNHSVALSFVISANGEQFTGNVSLVCKSYSVEITNISINDTSLGNSNGAIDPGETFEVVVTFENSGSAASPAISATIQNAGYISYANNTKILPAIPTENSREISFTATASNSISIGELVTFSVSATYPNGTIEYSQGFLAALLQIGEGLVENTHLPLEPYYRYSYSQTIYQASELNLGASQINKIAYQYNGNSAWTDSIVLYMGNTTKSNFTSTTNWVPLSNLTEVYNGNFSTTATAGWIEIELTTPFIYDGTSNLVIAFDENTYPYHSSNDEFYCYATPTNRSICYFNDSTNPNPASPPTGTLMSNNPNIRIFASDIPTEPIIEVNTASLDFGEVIVGSSVTRTFNIKNSGVGTLSGSIVLPDNFSFATRNSKEESSPTRVATQNFSFTNGQSQTYSVIFTPVTELCYNSNITINHNADEYPAYISVVACGIKPTYATDTESIYKSLLPDTSDNYNFTISNSGSGDLEVLLGITDSDRSSGGPDTYGYTWVDSNTPSVTYEWLEISNSGTVIAQGDDTSENLALPFTFNFYGEDYTSVNVCSNGFLSFLHTVTTYINASIPNTSTPNALIAPFWDDFKATGGAWGNIYYQNFSTYTVIQWENVSHYNYNNPTNSETFQVILYNNGDIKYQYKTIANDSSATIGIENHTGQEGLLVNFNSVFLENEYAILLTSRNADNWLSLSTDYLVIPEGSSATVVLNFTSDWLEFGSYNKSLYLITNDPDNEEIYIPVTLVVGGIATPHIIVSSSEIDLGTVFVDELTYETLTITNVGDQELNGNISASNNFSVIEARINRTKSDISRQVKEAKSSRNISFTLATGTSKSYEISHSTTSPGSFSGNITITSNDPDNMSVNIPLLLEIISPANIAINPQEISVVLQPELTDTRTFTITNSGDIELNCSLNLQFPDDRDITEIFSANFNDHDLTSWNIDYLYSADDTWHISDGLSGSSLNGTPFLFIDSNEAGDENLDDTIETPLFDISNYESITIAFDHYFNKYETEIADVDFWTGSAWINLGRWQGSDTGSWTSPVHFSHTLINEGYSNVKLRFHYYDANWEWYWAIDNLVVSGEEVPVPQWVTLAREFNNITVANHSSEEFTLDFSAVDFAIGDYSAVLNVNSNAVNNSNLNIPISLTIRALENEPNWQPVIYPTNSATVYAEVTYFNHEVAQDDLVSAWVGNECRGVGQIVIVRSQAFTTILVQSNGSTENVHFKFYDRSEDIVIEESNTTTITSGQVIGATTPFSINMGVIELITPSNVEVEIINSQATISWEAVPYADYYLVFYSADLSSWTDLGQVSGTTYQHTQPRGEAAFYKIKAMRNN